MIRWKIEDYCFASIDIFPKNVICQNISLSLSSIFFILLLVSCSDDSENPQSKVTISAISPDKGRPGTEVTITGSGFSPVKSENIVTMGSVEAEVTTATENQLGVFTYSFLPNGWKGIGSDKRNFPTRAMENSLPLINEKNRL